MTSLRCQCSGLILKEFAFEIFNHQNNFDQTRINFNLLLYSVLYIEFLLLEFFHILTHFIIGFVIFDIFIFLNI